MMCYNEDEIKSGLLYGLILVRSKGKADKFLRHSLNQSATQDIIVNQYLDIIGHWISFCMSHSLIRPNGKLEKAETG
jgi:hypothetical protein